MVRRLSWMFGLVFVVTVCGGAGCGKKPQPTASADAPSGDKKDPGGRTPAPGDGTKAAPPDPITRTAPTHILSLDRWTKHVKAGGGTPFAFSPDGKTLITGVRDGEDFAPKWKVVRLDPNTEQVLSDRLPFSEVMVFHRAAFGNNALDANQLKALALPEERQATIRDNVRAALVSRDIKNPDGTTFRRNSGARAYSPEAQYAVLRWEALAGEQDDLIEVWNLQRREPVALPSFPKVGMRAPDPTVAFSPDNKLLACAVDGQVKIWELPTGKLVQTLDCLVNKYLMFSPDGRWLLTQHFEDGRVNKPKTADPGKLVLWKVGDWKTFRALHPGGSEHNLGAQCGFSPDGKLLATTDEVAGDIRRVTIWDVEKGTLRGGYEVLEFADLAFSPDGTLLATWGGKLPHSINFWDVASGHLKYRIKSQSPTLTSFAPNGLVVTVQAGNGAALLYDLSSAAKVSFEDEVKKERDRLAGRK